MCCAPDEVASRLLDRYGDTVDRVGLSMPYDTSPDTLAAIVAGFRSDVAGPTQEANVPKGVFLALSNAADGANHDDFNQWYDDVHAKEVLALPGVNSARRFKLASTQIMPADDGGGCQYLALYEVDVDDWAAFAQSMQDGFGNGTITINPDLLQLDPMVQTMVFEEVSPEATA